MIGLKNSYELAYNGTENECRFELYADTAADLQGLTHIDGIKIQMGSECADIATGDKYILNGSGVWVLQPSDNAWQKVYTKPEIDSMITEIYDIIAYYHTTLVSDTGEITFYALAGYIATWKIYGNGQQTGTPTPDAPIMPDFCGTLDGTDWTIPITCAGQTTPLYLGEVSTTRRIKKRVFDGSELWNWSKSGNNTRVYTPQIPECMSLSPAICTHFDYNVANVGYPRVGEFVINSAKAIIFGVDGTTFADVDAWKSYLAQQYAAGTPVTVWYVLATEQTGIVNEPLMKIGDYADELNSTDAGVSIPTTKGQNTLTVDTELQPSLIEISGGYHA